MQFLPRVFFYFYAGTAEIMRFDRISGCKSPADLL